MTGVVNDFGTAVGGGSVQFGVGNPDTTIYSPSSYNDGKWHYMTATRVMSTGAMTLYVDGAQVATGTGGTNSQTAPTSVNIANDPAGGGYFPGSVDEFRFSTVARSAGWIATEYNNQSHRVRSIRSAVPERRPSRRERVEAAPLRSFRRMDSARIERAVLPDKETGH